MHEYFSQKEKLSADSKLSSVSKERRVLEKNNLQTMNYIINENNRKPSHYYKFSEKLYLLRYCCDKKMLQSLIY